MKRLELVEISQAWAIEGRTVLQFENFKASGERWNTGSVYASRDGLELEMKLQISETLRKLAHRPIRQVAGSTA